MEDQLKNYRSILPQHQEDIGMTLFQGSFLSRFFSFQMTHDIGKI